MEIVIENPGVETRPGLSIVTTAVTPTAGVAFTCCDSTSAAHITTAAMMRPTVSESDFARSPMCFPCRREYDPNSTVLLAQSHYPRQRDRYPLMPYDDPGGFAPPPLVRHVDRSSLPGVSGYETSSSYLGSQPFNDGTHLPPLRVDASGLLSTVPERRSPCNFETDAAEMSFMTPAVTGNTVGENQGKSNKIVLGARSSELEGRCVETNVDQDCRTFKADISPGETTNSPLFRRSSPFQFRASPITATNANTVLGKSSNAGTSCTSAAVTTTTTTSTTTTRMTTKADEAVAREGGRPGSTRAVSDAAETESHRAENAEGFPEEERAEAEGCEHRASEDFTETGASPKGSNVFLDNDAIQTLRVIILSEQL